MSSHTSVQGCDVEPFIDHRGAIRAYWYQVHERSSQNLHESVRLFLVHMVPHAGEKRDRMMLKAGARLETARRERLNASWFLEGLVEDLEPL